MLPFSGVGVDLKAPVHLAVEALQSCLRYIRLEWRDQHGDGKKNNDDGDKMSARARGKGVGCKIT